MRTLISHHRVAGIGLTLLILFSFIPGAFAQDSALVQQSQTFREIAKKSIPAVVFVEVSKSVEVMTNPFFSDPFDFFGPDFFDRFFRDRTPQRKKFQQRGQGSGFIISKDGYILTNNHVVGDQDKITVKLSDGRKFDAKLIGADAESDVALIKIDADDLPTLPLGNSDELEVGDWVLAIGNPFGLKHTVTAGIVSAKGRSDVHIAEYEDFIQTDAAINPGNSGGPLLNLKGEVIGINTAIVSRSGGYMGIGFAIPINMALAIKDQLIKNGKVVRGWLGVVIQDLTEDMAEQFGLKNAKGVLIAEVSKDSPADKAGLKHGDVIVEFDGHAVENVGQFRNQVALTPPGKKVEMVVIRDGKRKTLRVKIGNREKSPVVAALEGKTLDKLGIEVQNLTKDLADQLGYENGEGVLIADVRPGSPADEAGLRRGALILEANRRTVRNVKELTEALADSVKTKRVLLLVRNPRSSYAQFVLLRLE